jgi:hypothetical protein
MKLNIAYDQNGRIIAAAEVGPKEAGDQIAAQPGVSVAELEVPKEFDGQKLSDYVHRLDVDVGARKLVPKS